MTQNITIFEIRNRREVRFIHQILGIRLELLHSQRRIKLWSRRRI